MGVHRSGIILEKSSANRRIPLTDDSTNDAQSTEKRKWINPIFKGVLVFRFKQLNISIDTQVEVSRLPRTMDALVILRRKTDREKVKEETSFYYFNIHNQIEFKGARDPLTIPEYRLILGRANLYMHG